MSALKFEACLYAGTDLAPGEIHAVGPGRASIFTARCPGKAGPNEDGAFVIPLNGNRGILAVADGFGGQASGEVASRTALTTLIACIEEGESAGAELRAAILNGFEKANAAVTELAVGAGTTLAVLEVQGDTVRPYHVGDSMILAVGQRGKIRLQTVSHSPVGYAVEAGFLEEREAMRHADRHLVSNMVGAPDMRIEIGPPIRLRQHDTVVLASDGVSDNLHLEEIVEYVRKGPLIDVTQTVAVACSRRMRMETKGQPSKPDDMTFIVYRLNPPADRASKRNHTSP
jgi:serine/threonine protein phosphatase PrpC